MMYSIYTVHFILYKSQYKSHSTCLYINIDCIYIYTCMDCMYTHVYMCLYVSYICVYTRVCISGY